MELKAANECLRALKRPCTVEVFTDSQYVQRGISIWIHDWKRKGRMRKRPTEKYPDGLSVVNAWPLEGARRLSGLHQVTWTWVRGHKGIKFNETVDRLAEAAARNQIAGTASNS